MILVLESAQSLERILRLTCSRRSNTLPSYTCVSMHPCIRKACFTVFNGTLRGLTVQTSKYRRFHVNSSAQSRVLLPMISISYAQNMVRMMSVTTIYRQKDPTVGWNQNYIAAHSSLAPAFCDLLGCTVVLDWSTRYRIRNYFPMPTAYCLLPSVHWQRRWQTHHIQRRDRCHHQQARREGYWQQLVDTDNASISGSFMWQTTTKTTTSCSCWLLTPDDTAASLWLRLRQQRRIAMEIISSAMWNLASRHCSKRIHLNTPWSFLCYDL